MRIFTPEDPANDLVKMHSSTYHQEYGVFRYCEVPCGVKKAHGLKVKFLKNFFTLLEQEHENLLKSKNQVSELRTMGHATYESCMKISECRSKTLENEKSEKIKLTHDLKEVQR